MEERSTDRLSRYVIYAAEAALIIGACWLLRSVLAYIFGAVVFTLLARPIKHLLGKVHIKKGKTMPSWLLSLLSMLIVAMVFVGILIWIVPTVSSVMANFYNAGTSGVSPLRNLNSRLVETIPALGANFRIEKFLLSKFQESYSMSAVSLILGSVASTVASIGVAIFSVAFISFFFLTDEKLYSNIVCTIAPDRLESRLRKAIANIEYLLTRYFVGLTIEVAGVTLLNFIGLITITRLNFTTAIGIAVLTGILNIIPYIGPLTGGIIGTILGIITRFYGATPVGLWLSNEWFVVALILIFTATQLVDNVVFQPVIYSTSIRCHPLEIFIVILLVGHFGGVLWMIGAIPAYTCVRVIAGQFFRRFKIIAKLIPEDETELVKKH